MKIPVFLLALLLLSVSVVADEDYYFSVYDNSGSQIANPGDEVFVNFILSNRNLVYPANVTAYIDLCPVGWTCQKDVFSFETKGRHPVNLSLKIPQTALPKKYTMYIRLESEEDTMRGFDRFIITIPTSEDVQTKSYADYSKEVEKPVGIVSSPALRPVVKSVEVAESEPILVLDVIEPVVEQRQENNSIRDIISNVEKIESSRQFMEYLMFILLVLLVFAAVGAFVSYRKSVSQK